MTDEQIEAAMVTDCGCDVCEIGREAIERGKLLAAARPHVPIDLRRKIDAILEAPDAVITPAASPLNHEERRA